MAQLSTAQLMADTAEFLDGFSLDDVATMEVAFLDGMGLKNSHDYRQKLLGLFKKHLKKSSDQFMLFMIVEQIKNKGRITKWFENPANRTTHGTKPWWKPIKEFVTTHTVQYVQEVERIPANADKFPLVNIPTCYPSMSALAFKTRMHRNGKIKTMTPEVLFETFIDNRWAAQMNINDALMDQVRQKDRQFWVDTVKKSKNPFTDAFEGGFNEEYFKTKSQDKYLFYNLVGGKIVASDEVYDRQMIIEWMTSALS